MQRIKVRGLLRLPHECFPTPQTPPPNPHSKHRSGPSKRKNSRHGGTVYRASQGSAVVLGKTGLESDCLGSNSATCYSTTLNK